MPIVTLNGTAIYYEKHGTGKPIAFVPGLGATRAMFQPKDTFSRTHSVITFDVRGTGRSGKLTGWRNILHRQVTDLASLLDHLSIERAALCGVSHGGIFAQRFALSFRARCAVLVVVDSFSDFRPRNLRELGLMAAVNVGTPAMLLPKSWMTAIVRTQYARWPLARQRLDRIVHELRGYETMKTRLVINWINFTPELRRVTCPTLGIVGDSSPLAVRLMQRFVEAIPGARLEIVPDSFDPTSLCQPETFNRLLADFLRSIGW